MQETDTNILGEKTILFVDDDPFTCMAVEKMLQKRFKKVWVAKNGKEGLEAFTAYHPDIVMTDLEMPVMNGIVMLNNIKAIKPSAVVVIVTAFSNEIDDTVHADAIIIKPIERKNLLATFVSLLR